LAAIVAVVEDAGFAVAWAAAFAVEQDGGGDQIA
jgi:hypothetical protein